MCQIWLKLIKWLLKKNTKFFSMYFRYLEKARSFVWANVPNNWFDLNIFYCSKTKGLGTSSWNLERPLLYSRGWKFHLCYNICRIKGKKNWYITNYTEESNTVNVVHMKTHKNNWSKTTRFLNKKLMLCVKYVWKLKVDL